MHEDEEENGKSAESERKEGSSARLCYERFFEAVDPEDRLGGQCTEHCDYEERPRSREGKERPEQLEDEPAGPGREEKTEDGNNDCESRGAASEEDSGEPQGRTKNKAERRHSGAEGLDEVGAVEIFGVHGFLELNSKKANG